MRHNGQPIHATAREQSRVAFVMTGMDISHLQSLMSVRLNSYRMRESNESLFFLSFFVIFLDCCCHWFPIALVKSVKGDHKRINNRTVGASMMCNWSSSPIRDIPVRQKHNQDALCFVSNNDDGCGFDKITTITCMGLCSEAMLTRANWGQETCA